MGLVFLGVYSFPGSINFNSMTGMGNMMNGNGSVLTTASVNSLQQKATNGIINKTKNSITFSQNSVNLVALAAPPTHKGMYFEIDNLINPTLMMKAGTNIHLTLVNEDNVMHGFEIVKAKPPFSPNPMMAYGSLFNSFIMPIWGTNSSQYYSSSTTINISTSGTYSYICPFPKHAQKGMYGKIIVD
jgi:rusticyanin